MVQRQTIGHPGADVMGHQRHPLVAEQAGLFVYIRGSRTRVVPRQGFVRIPKAPHIGDDDLKAFPQNRDLLAPAVPELWPAMEQDHGSTVPMSDVMDVNAADHGGAMRPLHNPTSFFPVIDTRAFSAFRKSYGWGARVVRCLGPVNPCQASLGVCAAAGLRSMM